MREFEHAGPELLAQRRHWLRIKTSATIDAAPAEVWALLSDHQTWPTWHDDYEEHEAMTSQIEGLGAAFRSREWWKLRSESEITRWEEGKVVGLTLRRANVWRWLVRSSYNELEIEPMPNHPSQCIVHYRFVFTGTVLFWLLSASALGPALIGIYATGRSALRKLQRLVE